MKRVSVTNGCRIKPVVNAALAVVLTMGMIPSSAFAQAATSATQAGSSATTEAASPGDASSTASADLDIAEGEDAAATSATQAEGEQDADAADSGASAQSIALDVQTEYAFSGGSGDEDAPYEISKPQDLVDLASAVALQSSSDAQAAEKGAEYAAAYYKLTADIDMTGTDFAGIGSYTSDSSNAPFAGTFDGGHYTITLGISTQSTAPTGLFNFAQGASARDSAVIKNVTVDGSVYSGYSSNGCAGGIVGLARNAEIDSCLNRATVSSTALAGGVVGGNEVDIASDYGSALVVRNCANTGSVVARYYSGTAGGIIGAFGAATATTQLDSCYNTGTVTGGTRAGGIVGSWVSRGSSTFVMKQSIIRNSYNAGVVIGKNVSINGSYHNIGGLVGIGSDAGTTTPDSLHKISNCYSLENTVYCGSIADTNLYSQLCGPLSSSHYESENISFKTADEMAAWDFVCELGQANFAQQAGYPVLNWQDDVTPFVQPATVEGLDAQGSIEAGNNITLSVTASKPVSGAGKSGTLTYQWFASNDASASTPDDDTAIEGATIATFTTTNSSNGTVWYYCKVTNTVGDTSRSLTSAPVCVVWVSGKDAATPSIKSQPHDATASQDGDKPQLSVGYEYASDQANNGQGDITYQWYASADATVSADDTAIEGATEATFDAPTDYAGTYYYYCKVTNTYDLIEKSVMSGVAKVVVEPGKIATAADLVALANRVNGTGATDDNTETLEGKTFVLTEDIDMSGIEWKAIGGYYVDTSYYAHDHIFRGTFDGQNHKIYNLSLSDMRGITSDHNAYNGLFGYIQDAVIENLTVEGSITGDPDGEYNSYVGGIVGRADGKCTLQNIVFEGTITGRSYVGGIVGYIADSTAAVSTIDGCGFRGSLKAYSRGGGIVGCAGNVSITNCYNAGTIDSQEYAGGIVGTTNNGYSVYGQTTIGNCFNAGKIVRANADESVSYPEYQGAIIGDTATIYSPNNYWLVGSAYYAAYTEADGNVECSDMYMRSTDFVEALNAATATDTAEARDMFTTDNLGGFPRFIWESQVEVTRVQLNVTPEGASAASVTVVGEDGTTYVEAANTGLEAGKHLYLLPVGTYTITADCFGYKTYTKTITVGGEGEGAITADTTLDIAMTPAEAHTVTFNLSTPDGSTDGISDARLWLASDEYGDLLAAEPYSDATRAITLPVGSYTYSWQLDEYMTVHGTFTITEGGADFAQSVQFASPAVWSGGKVEPVFDKDGVYLVSSGEELCWIEEAVNGGRCAIDFKLVADIVLNAADNYVNKWTPIGNGETLGTVNCVYVGDFDGQGHVIEGLYVDSTQDYVGLFGAVCGNTLQNVVIGGAVRTTADCAGGLVGYIQASEYYTTYIKNVGNNASVQASLEVGGIVGAVATGSSGYVEISRCYNKGQITGLEGDNYEADCAGGIVGETYGGAAANLLLTSCYNLGDVAGRAHTAGGILGTGSATIAQCYNAGNITIDTYNEAYEFASGAIIGVFPSSGVEALVSDTYYMAGTCTQPFGYVSSEPTGLSATELASADAFSDAVMATLPDYLKQAINGEGEAASGIFNNGLPYLSWENISRTVAAPPDLLGSKTNPIKISTEDELVDLSNKVRQGNTFANLYIELTDDIALSDDSAFLPIGSIAAKNAFEGNFDGLGHAVTNLNLKLKTSNFNDAGAGVGLFGYIRHAEVSHVEVDGNVYGAIWVGGVVGYAYDSFVSDCISRASVEAFSDDDTEGTYASGIVGQVYCSGTETGGVTSCVFYGTVKASGYHAAAIATYGTATPKLVGNYYLSTAGAEGTDHGDNGTTGVDSLDSNEIAWKLNTCDSTRNNALIWGNKAGSGVQFAGRDGVVASYGVIIDSTAANISVSDMYFQEGAILTFTIDSVKKGYTLKSGIKVESVDHFGRKTVVAEEKQVPGDLPASMTVAAAPASDLYISVGYDFDTNTKFDLTANVTSADDQERTASVKFYYVDETGKVDSKATKYAFKGDTIRAVVTSIDEDSQYSSALATASYVGGQTRELGLTTEVFGREFTFTVIDADTVFDLVLEAYGTQATSRGGSLEVDQSLMHAYNSAYWADGNYLLQDLIVDDDRTDSIGITTSNVTYPGQVIYDVGTVETLTSLQYSQVYSYLDGDGNKTTAQYTGVDVGLLLTKYCYMNSDVDGSTPVTFYDAWGNSVELTVADILGYGRNSYAIDGAYAGDSMVRGVPVLLAASEGEAPYSFSEGGPLKLVVGQTNPNDANAGCLLEDVVKIFVGDVSVGGTELHNRSPYSTYSNYCLYVDVYRNGVCVQKSVPISMADIEAYMTNDTSSRVSTVATATRYYNGGEAYTESETDHYQGINIWYLLKNKFNLSDYDMSIGSATFYEAEYGSSYGAQPTAIAKATLSYLAGGEDGSYSDSVVNCDGYTRNVAAQITTAKNGMPLMYSSTESGVEDSCYNYRGPLIALLPSGDGVEARQADVVTAGDAIEATFLKYIVLDLGDSADKTALNDTIDTVQRSGYSDIAVSADGAGLDDSAFWVSSAMLTELTSALKSAVEVSEYSEASAQEVDAACANLKAAADAFWAAVAIKGYTETLAPSDAALSAESLAVLMDKTTGLAEVSVAADASSVRLKYSGAGAVTAVSADPSIATATYDAATGRITVQALKAGSTTVQVNVGADSVYAASEPLAFTINVVESEFLGGSLRMDVPASSGLTSLRMGYRLTMSATAFDAGAVGWRWAYGTAADNLTQASDAIKYTVESRDEAAGTVTIVSNIVFTDIPQRYYDVTLYSQLQIFTKSNNGEGKAASAGVYGRSVSQVAGMIALDTSASIDEIAYAQALLEA